MALRGFLALISVSTDMSARGQNLHIGHEGAARDVYLQSYLSSSTRVITPTHPQCTSPPKSKCCRFCSVSSYFFLKQSQSLEGLCSVMQSVAVLHPFTRMPDFSGNGCLGLPFYNKGLFNLRSFKAPKDTRCQTSTGSS
uniref:Uncharacterized protein n=1 Tax=Sphaerodactylus townsendi TaxID=933632 RepID=A0ACB8ES54_9SAUR